MFQSGYGDGMYPAYWGIDNNGEITAFFSALFKKSFASFKFLLLLCTPPRLIYPLIILIE